MRWLALVALSACVSTSQVGRHVARNGDWLAVHRCMIVLEDRELHASSCTVEQLPLAAVPQAVPPLPPGAGSPPQPLPPATPQR